jgi:hypothetical protein
MLQGVSAFEAGTILPQNRTFGKGEKHLRSLKDVCEKGLCQILGVDLSPENPEFRSNLARIFLWLSRVV